MAPPLSTTTFRPTAAKDKKLATLSVISFNDAHTIPYSRTQLCAYFDVSPRSVQRWCSITAGTPTTTISATTNAATTGSAASDSSTPTIAAVDDDNDSCDDDAAAPVSQLVGGSGGSGKPVAEQKVSPAKRVRKQRVAGGRRGGRRRVAGNRDGILGGTGIEVVEEGRRKRRRKAGVREGDCDDDGGDGDGDGDGTARDRGKTRGLDLVTAQLLQMQQEQLRTAFCNAHFQGGREKRFAYQSDDEEDWSSFA